MKIKNAYMIIIPIVLIVLLSIVDTLIFGLENSHINVINVLMILLLYVVIFGLIIFSLSESVYKSYREKKFNSVIKKGSILTKFLVYKNSLLNSKIHLYISISYLMVNEFNQFERHIKMVTNRQYDENKTIWICMMYYLRKDFSNLNKVYNSKNFDIDIKSNLYKMHVLFRGINAYHKKNCQEAKTILNSIEMKFNSKKAESIYKDIINEINQNIQDNQV